MVTDEEDLAITQILDHITSTASILRETIKIFDDLLTEYKDFVEHHEKYHPECQFMEELGQE